jgi:hypothetical protein
MPFLKSFFRNNMQKELSFDELDQLTTDHLQAMLDTGRLSDENSRRVKYEIQTRGIELPEDWKLNN